MFKYFTKNNLDFISLPMKKYNRFSFIRRRYMNDLNKVLNYYRHRERAVNNDHLLSRLIETAIPSTTLTMFDYFRLLDTNARFVSKQFDITSSINYGKVHNNIIYSKNSDEIFIYVNSSIDFENIHNTWREMESLRVVYTDDTDLDMKVPFIDVGFSSNTLNVFEVDVTMMGMQYYY